MEWNINKNSKQCLSCDKGFQDNDEFFSALYADSDEFSRKDFCLDCWDKCDKLSIFSFWKFKIVRSTEPKKPAIDSNYILDLFLKLEPETDDKSKINLRYVLALFLMRKKLLKLKPSKKQEDKETLVFHFPKEDRDIRFFDPKLTSDEIIKISDEVKTLLDNPGFAFN
ncbi:MAG: hypothetical protein ACUZ8H_10870 [Candidatus Anammoxibacter sp.]